MLLIFSTWRTQQILRWLYMPMSRGICLLLRILWCTDIMLLGFSFMMVGGHHHTMLKEDGEVILFVGAVDSTQLLLMSGIGPRPCLSCWEIPEAKHTQYSVKRLSYWR